jgi:hypothetical protein
MNLLHAPNRHFGPLPASERFGVIPHAPRKSLAALAGKLPAYVLVAPPVTRGTIVATVRKLVRYTARHFEHQSKRRQQKLRIGDITRVFRGSTLHRTSLCHRDLKILQTGTVQRPGNGLFPVENTPIFVI